MKVKIVLKKMKVKSLLEKLVSNLHGIMESLTKQHGRK
jgi:hypothetical protein